MEFVSFDKIATFDTAPGTRQNIQSGTFLTRDAMTRIIAAVTNFFHFFIRKRLVMHLPACAFSPFAKTNVIQALELEGFRLRRRNGDHYHFVSQIPSPLSRGIRRLRNFFLRFF
jgi:hypothetical protein